MRWCLDLLYLTATIVSAPVWIIRLLATGKWRTDWAGRFGFGPVRPDRMGPRTQRVLIHAVSVGEVNATRTLVAELERRSDEIEIVLSATTNTGSERATAIFGERYEVVRYPLDLSWAVDRFLARIKPDVVVFIELELWPNFTAACQRRGTLTCVVNGRLSDRSHRRYRLIRRLVHPSFRGLSIAAVQNEDYARRFVDLGTPIDRVVVTDTMKWDTAELVDHVPGADELADAIGIDRSKPLVVAGSTAPEEHALLRDALDPYVQLLCAPRRPEWFNQAAEVFAGCARRSKGDRGSATGRFLLDTIGELRMAYALADVVVVGRTFGNRYGSDMMEPIALGKPTIVGPSAGDFQHTVDALLAAEGLIQCEAQHLAQTIRTLLQSPEKRQALSERGRAVIRRHQGASERHVAMIMELLQAKNPSSQQSWDDEGGERRKSNEIPPGVHPSELHNAGH